MSRYVKHALKITKSLYSNYSKIGMMTSIITNKKYYSYASSSCFIFWNSSFVMVFSPEIKKTHAQGCQNVWSRQPSYQSKGPVQGYLIKKTPSIKNLYSCCSSVQIYRSKIFLAVQTWLPSVRNFSLAVQPSYQSVRNKLSAFQPVSFIRFKRLRGPFLTRSTAVRFTRLTESRYCTFSRERSQIF